MAVFGNQINEANSNTGLANWCIAGKFTLSEAGTVTKLTAYIENSGSACTIKAVIYSDSSGEPGSRLSSGTVTDDDYSVGTSVSIGWNDITFDAGLHLDAGDYWLGLIASSTASDFIIRFSDSTGLGQMRLNSDTYSDGPLSTWGTSEYSYTYRLAIYATYTPDVTEPTLTCTLSGVRHAYTYSIADETRTQVVHPADWLAVHSVAAGTALNGLAPVGSVVPFAGLIANIPAGWLLCNGDSLLRAGSYADLYTAIGTTYGYADGTHFNLPDCRDKFIVGANSDDASLPKASITGGLTQSYSPATASLTHSMTVADHTLTHAGLSVAAHTMTHSVQIADHPSLQLTGTIANQATAGRAGTKAASLVVSQSTHAVTWPSIAAQVHTITQPDHTVTHAVTQPDAHGTGGTVTHGFTVPSAHTMPVPVPAFLAVAYIIRYA